MKYPVPILLALLLLAPVVHGQADSATSGSDRMANNEFISIESHLSGLHTVLTHQKPAVISSDYPVLFLHGSSFPSALSAGFKMNNYSWMDNLTENGYDVYALDFLGYGQADRYPEMEKNAPTGKPVGRALTVCQDVDKAVDAIIKKTGKSKVYLIGHSWGGSVAALYAGKYHDKVAKLVLFAAITTRSGKSEWKKAQVAYEMQTPDERIALLKNLTPEGKICRLEPEILTIWGTTWLHADALAATYNRNKVCFPSGPDQDVEDLKHGGSYYDPADIQAPTLVIRGEWDNYPNAADEEKLFSALENARYKKYVVIEQGTHVLHLEKSRYQLYNEVLHFLKWEVNQAETSKHVIAVIFEVMPAPGHKEDYLKIAQSLKPELIKIKGFISIERFQSISDSGKILSLSFWDNEDAIKQWRNLESHRIAQAKGREYIFKDYHLRVAQVVRDYGMNARQEAPIDSKIFHGK